VYVDDDIYLDVTDKHHFEQAIATSIEAIFILLCESNTAHRQDPKSWDKLHELLIAQVNWILGLVLDLRRLTVGTPPDFIASTINLLRSTWGPHRCSFKVKEAEELTGKLNHIAFGAPWLKYLLGNIYSSLTTALCLNKAHLIRMSPRFHEALRNIQTAPTSAAGDAKRAFYTGATARRVHGSNTLHHINTNLRCDIQIIDSLRIALSPAPSHTSCHTCPLGQHAVTPASPLWAGTARRPSSGGTLNGQNPSRPAPSVM
jgi:hypothetical protein